MVIDDSMRDALLQDPEVKKAVANAGHDALKNPMVQQALLAAAQEKFPEAMHEAPAKIAEWAKDPEVHHMAVGFAKRATRVTISAITEAPREVYALLQQGPAGVRVLAFLGGAASVVLGFWHLLHFFEILTKPVMYMIDVYQMLFAIITVLFEAKPEWLACLKWLDKFHDLLCEYCLFLCTAFGRGLFYLFQASLWLGEFEPHKGLAEWFELGVGAYMFFIGVLHVLMHFGIMPQSIAEKGRIAARRATTLASEVARKTIHSVDNIRQSLHDAREVADKEAASGSGGSATKRAAPSEVELGPPTFATDHKAADARGDRKSNKWPARNDDSV